MVISKIRKPVINTFNRVGIDYKQFEGRENEKVTVSNRFGGGSCETTPFVAHLIDWVYATNNDYDAGIKKVNLSDFDRVRYFILDKDANAYMVTLD